jgi:hypothetical protein
MMKLKKKTHELKRKKEKKNPSKPLKLGLISKTYNL